MYIAEPYFLLLRRIAPFGTLFAVRLSADLLGEKKEKKKGEMKLSSFYRKYSESLGKSVSFKTLSLTSMVTVYRAFVLIS